jgi:hypothetical protein
MPERWPSGAPIELLHGRHADPPPGNQISRAAPRWARCEAPHRPLVSPWPKEAPRWAPVPSPTRLGFGFCPPQPEEEENRGSSILP